MVGGGIASLLRGGAWGGLDLTGGGGGLDVLGGGGLDPGAWPGLTFIVGPAGRPPSFPPGKGDATVASKAAVTFTLCGGASTVFPGPDALGGWPKSAGRTSRCFATLTISFISVMSTAARRTCDIVESPWARNLVRL
jgi:hypothetical protein